MSVAEKEVSQTIAEWKDSLKGKILLKVAQSNDEEQLREILEFIEMKQSNEKKESLQLTRHISEVFEKYNNTLQRLAE